MTNLMKSKTMWIAFAIVFVSGLAIGTVVGMMIKNRPPAPGNREAQFQDMIKFRLIRHMDEELEFTPIQQAKAEKIFTKMSDDIRKFHNDERPKIKSIIDNAFAEVEMILTDEQKVKMAEVRERMAQYHRSRREGDNKYGPPHHRDGSRGKPGLRDNGAKDGDKPFRPDGTENPERNRDGKDRCPPPEKDIQPDQDEKPDPILVPEQKPENPPADPKDKL